MSPMSGLQSPGSRGSAGFSVADSFGDRRPSFESQSRPEMGGQIRGSSPPGFRDPAGSPSGVGGQCPSFGSQSQTSFGGSTGFDDQGRAKGRTYFQ
ncbi:hypothetical protein DPMN_024824 [Dreissena polymorpha]|uniref:Uncharacterized protein n=1 Tax=Dreissena polymorpha TaxID=45954 RepID=A0A9D4RB41_DREPO|nr:hypothetical protein DPMN_024824 [Dreissena polymorpha]